jgi:predicted CoA-binding protein
VRTIAVVGASPNPARQSNEVLGFLVAKAFETYPVNPWRAGGLIRGRSTYARLADVPALIDMVDVFRNSAAPRRCSGGGCEEGPWTGKIEIVGPYFHNYC